MASEHASSMSPRLLSITRRTLATIAFPLLLSIGGMLLLRHYTTPTAVPVASQSSDIDGPSATPEVNIFLGALFLLTVVVPPLVLGEQRIVRQLAVAASAVTPVCLMTVRLIGPNQVHASEWLAVAGVLIAFPLALAGISLMLRHLRFTSAAAAALSVTLGIVWITWPVWASRTWEGRASESTIERLAPYHPGMLIDGQLARGLGSWTTGSVAYGLTDLNQNVMYPVPASVWRGVIAFLVLAGAGFGWGAYREFNGRQRLAPSKS